MGNGLRVSEPRWTPDLRDPRQAAPRRSRPPAEARARTGVTRRPCRPAPHGRPGRAVSDMGTTRPGRSRRACLLLLLSEMKLLEQQTRVTWSKCGPGLGAPLALPPCALSSPFCPRFLLQKADVWPEVLFSFLLLRS